MSGSPVAVAVGYVDEPDGSLLVAAGDPGADWARNLEADARALVTLGDRTFEVVGEVLAGPDAERAVVALILKYGTSAERLGRGPVFRLQAADAPISPLADRR